MPNLTKNTFTITMSNPFYQFGNQLLRYINNQSNRPAPPVRSVRFQPDHFCSECYSTILLLNTTSKPVALALSKYILRTIHNIQVQPQSLKKVG